jgi:signal transduction histidine kinase
MTKIQTESAGGGGRLGRRALVSGERDVAGLGLSMLGVIGGLSVGGAGLAAIEIERIERNSRDGHVSAVGQTLAQAAEEMIAEDRLSAVRRMVAESVTSGRLSACRIVLGEGEVVASSDPGQINVLALPERWPGASVTPEAGSEWASAQSFPVVIDGRGSLTLEVVGAACGAAGWTDLVSGIGLIGAGGAAVLWTIYRSMRRRVARLGVVCDAVLALGRGETSTEAVRLSPVYGEVAEAWARVLEQRAAWEQGVATAPAAEVSERRTSGSSEGLAGAIDAMWQGILLVDRNLNVTYANGAAGLLLEAPRDQIVGGAIAGRFGNKEVEETIQAVASGTSRRRSGLEVKRADGRTILRFTVRAVRREDEAAALVVVEDVTQQRAAEEARHSFVAQAAHELRTPLTNIRLYVEQAIEASDEEVELRSQAMNVINTESQRLERLVQDMLSVAEIESGSMSVHSGDVRLTQLLDELSSDYIAQAREKEITLKFDLPPKLPVIKGDRDKLSLAMHNIVGNALKYTPKGGAVTVKVSWERDEVRICVEDTGIGIREAEQTLIFDKFYRAKDARLSEITGTGLGLTLARDVVRLHGGDITLRSELDKGSTFTIAIPARAAA